MLLLFIVGIASCNRKSPVKEKNVEDVIQEDSINLQEEVITPPEYVITYHLDSLENESKLDSLLSLYNEQEQKIIYTLNRIEEVRVGVGTKLIIPDTLFQDQERYSPFPKKLDLLDPIPKTVLISQRVQAFGLYENGNLVKWGAISGGKQSTPTPNGLHYGNYKAKRKISTVNEDWILPYYFNFMNFEGVGVHQYLLPGFPASHACVRLYMEDAMFIYNWASQWELDASGRKIEKNGTPFIVYGEYDFGREVPWYDLALDPHANKINEGELEILKDHVATYLKDERNYHKKDIENKDLNEIAAK